MDWGKEPFRVKVVHKKKPPPSLVKEQSVFSIFIRMLGFPPEDRRLKLSSFSMVLWTKKKKKKKKKSPKVFLPIAEASMSGVVEPYFLAFWRGRAHCPEPLTSVDGTKYRPFLNQIFWLDEARSFLVVEEFYGGPGNHKLCL